MTSFALTSTVHELPDVGGGHQVVASQIVRQLASKRHNDCHDQMGQSWHHAHLKDDRGEGTNVCVCVCVCGTNRKRNFSSVFVLKTEGCLGGLGSKDAVAFLLLSTLHCHFFFFTVWKSKDLKWPRNDFYLNKPNWINITPPCWSQSQRLLQSRLAGWWAVGRKSSSCRSLPRWWRKLAWRWRSVSTAF